MHACICIDVHFASLASSYTQRIPSRSSSGLLPSGLPTAQPAASQPLTQRPPNRSTSCLPTAHSAAPNRSLLVTAVSQPLTFGHSGLPTAHFCSQRSPDRSLLFTAVPQPLTFVHSGLPTDRIHASVLCVQALRPRNSRAQFAAMTFVVTFFVQPRGYGAAQRVMLLSITVDIADDLLMLYQHHMYSYLLVAHISCALIIEFTDLGRNFMVDPI